MDQYSDDPQSGIEGHQDEERKKRYINRHIKKELPLWSHIHLNLLTPAYYSRYLTW